MATIRARLRGLYSRCIEVVRNMTVNYLLTPISLVMPKQKGMIICFGRDAGEFVDNVKYFFLYTAGARDREVTCFFLTEKRPVYEKLRREGFKVLYFPSFKAFLCMLRARVLIVDNITWTRGSKYTFFLRAKKVQLWHGVGLKAIELNNKFEKQAQAAETKKRDVADSRFPRYDLLVSTSGFYTEHVFRRSLLGAKIIESGYPRNDIFFRKIDGADIEADTATIEKIKKAKSDGCKIVLYAPTFRERIICAQKTPALDLAQLHAVAARYRIIFVFKSHPWQPFPLTRELDDFLLEYQPSKDVYPALPLTDLLITDYSSLYMDYLLCDKPVIFFPYDYQDYISRDREIQFDYDSMTPGPKCYDQRSLESEIIKCLVDGQDSHVGDRKQIAELAFAYRDGEASKRIMEEVKKIV
ncbi:MAG: CDP-glycerol glycerophosphotransferase family protein [Candidatus Omnitrophota bacterium]